MKHKDRQDRNRHRVHIEPTDKKEPKKSIKKRISDVLDVPQSIFSDIGRVEITGNGEAIVEGNLTVLEYDENMIKLNTGSCQVWIGGRELSMDSMNLKSVIVRGTIDCIEFKGRREGDARL